MGSTITAQADPASVTAHPAKAKPKTPAGQSSGKMQRLMITAIALIGVLVLLFPTISNWFSTLGYTEQHGGYDALIDTLSPEERAQILQSARDYNANLPTGPLRDPYMLDDRGDTVDLRDDYDTYYEQLNLGDGEPMAWVNIPSIDALLPVYHGTDAETLDIGAGHLHGSGLPVGGESTHAVVTAHSGRVNAKLFTDLDRVKIGDVFFSEVVGERLYYRVDNIEVVTPVYSGDKLRQVQGEDYLTLLTCTPTGVNSHRLLVRGVRIDAPSQDELNTDLNAADYIADFPWWIPTVVGVPAAVWYLLGIADKRAGRNKQDGQDTRGKRGRRAKPGVRRSSSAPPGRPHTVFDGTQAVPSERAARSNRQSECEGKGNAE